LPLSPAGKVERSALPAPQLESEAYAAPQGELEQALAAIWSALLGVPRVGRDDNFFALGGHSLLAVQLVSRLNLALAVSLPLRAVFETKSLSLLAAEVATLQQQASQQSKMDDLASFLDALEST
ncbi:phosphopantetheine-binding protein, partial [Janthinobacterium lividum]